MMQLSQVWLSSTDKLIVSVFQKIWIVVDFPIALLISGFATQVVFCIVFFISLIITILVLLPHFIDKANDFRVTALAM